jgi:hypothetical protein
VEPVRCRPQSPQSSRACLRGSSTSAQCPAGRSGQRIKTQDHHVTMILIYFRRHVTTRHDISGFHGVTANTAPYRSSPDDREDHHPQKPSGYVEQLLGSVDDLTPRREALVDLEAGNIQRVGQRAVALDACICAAARSPCTQSASSARSAFYAAPAPPQAICSRFMDCVLQPPRQTLETTPRRRAPA